MTPERPYIWRAWFRYLSKYFKHHSGEFQKFSMKPTVVQIERL